MPWFGTPDFSKLAERGDYKRIIKALAHKNAEVRREAAAAIRYLAFKTLEVHHSRVYGPLVTALRDKEWRVRLAAAESLAEWSPGRIDDPSKPLGPPEPLIAALDDQESWVRRTAARSLGKLRVGAAVHPLIASLKDEASDVRAAAADALGWIGDRQASNALLAALHDQDGHTRAAAAWALGRIGESRAIEPLIRALTDDFTVRSGDGDDFTVVQDAAVASLAAIGGPAIRPLIRSLSEDGRARARIALVRIGVPSVDELILALKNTNSYTRRFSAQALGEIRDIRAVEPLIRVLASDNHPDVRQDAADALGDIGHASAVQPLIAALRTTDLNLRRFVVSALARIGDASAVNPLLQAYLDTKEYAVREEILDAVKKIAGPDADRIVAGFQARE